MIDLVLWTSVIGGTAIGATLVELKIKKTKEKKKKKEKYENKYKKIEGINVKSVKRIVDKKTNEIFEEEKVPLREKEIVRGILYSKVTDELFKEI